MQRQEQSCNLKRICEDFYVDKSQKLGNGASSTVYKGYCESKNQIIAVKLLTKSYMHNHRKYQREIINLVNLSKEEHPNIMGFYGYCEDEADGIYCFLEFCPGDSLKKYMKDNKKINEIKVLSLFEQIINGMIFLNKNDIIHRDLKPDNIFLNKDTLKIGDFGVAREFQQKMTNNVGTEAYSAPQIFLIFGNGDYSYNCDVWSAGVILYQMLTGKMLFKNVRKSNQLYDQIQKLRNQERSLQIPDSVNPKWIQILKSMLIFDPKKRPTFEQLKQMYENIFQRMKEQMKYKYGYEDYYDGGDSDILVLSSSNPYRSSIGSSKNSLFSSYLKKLNEEKSLQRIENIKRWFTFQIYKSQFLNCLPRIFNNSSYEWTSNIYKFILALYSLMAYIKKCENLIQEMCKLIIITPSENIEFRQLCECHHETYNTMLNTFKRRVAVSSKKYLQVVKKSVIDQILKRYKQKEDEKKILQNCNGLLQIASKIKDKVAFDEELQEFDYLGAYKQVANCKKVYLDLKKIGNKEKFTRNDCKTYCHIRVISQLQRLFPAAHYRNENLIETKKQELQNSTKQQYLEMIEKQNINYNPMLHT